MTFPIHGPKTRPQTQTHTQTQIQTQIRIQTQTQIQPRTCLLALLALFVPSFIGQAAPPKQPHHPHLHPALALSFQASVSADPSLSIVPAALTFPTPIPVTAVSQPLGGISITNAGPSPLPVSLSTNGDFRQQNSCPAILAPAQVCAVAITFVPSQPGLRLGTLQVSTNPAFSPATIPLSATATPILPPTSPLDFGSTTILQPVTLFYPIAPPFSSLSVSTTGPFTVALIPNLGFGPGQPDAVLYASTATLACPACFLAVRFTPQTTGLQTGTLTFSSDPAGQPVTVPLTGTGAPGAGLLLTPAVQTFDPVPAHSIGAPFFFTLTNLVASGQAISLQTPTLPAGFLLDPSLTSGQPCTGSLAFTASCTVPLRFAPTQPGPLDATLTLNTSAGTVSASLTGLATPDPGLALDPTALVFLDVPGQSALQQSIALTNTSSTTLQLGSPTVTTTAFSASTACSSLPPGATCSITINFHPGPAPSSDILTLPITLAGALTLTSIPLTGAYTRASSGAVLAPTQIDLGPVPIATESLLRQFTLQNLSSQPVAVDLAFPRQFVLRGPPCTALAAGASCDFSAAFIPLTAGQTTGSLIATLTPAGDASPTTTIAYLAGYGTPHAAAMTLATPASAASIVSQIDFGQILSGQSSTRTLTLTNSDPGSPPITLRRIASAPPFLATSTCTLPLDSGESCTVTVAYTPVNQVPLGTVSPPANTDIGLLTIESDAQSSPQLVNLTGRAAPLAAATPINLLPVATYALSRQSLTFPFTTPGTVSPAQTIVLTNTGSIPLHLLAASPSAEFPLQTTCATVPAASSCTFTVSSQPQTAAAHFAALQLTSDSTDSLSFVSLYAEPPPIPLTSTPLALNFGPVPLGTSATLPVQFTNPGDVPVLLSTPSLLGDYALTTTCPSSGNALPAGETCTLELTFTPTRTGIRPGTLTLLTSASPSPILLPLTGIGTQPTLQFTPTSLNFGNVPLGASSTFSVILTNTGTATLAAFTPTLTGDYTLAQPCSALAPNATCTLQVTFTPTAAGPRSGTLTLTGDFPASPATIPLTGNGIPPPGTFTLTVNGSASTTVQAPAAASFSLTATPINAFTGTLDLSCAPLTPAPYAVCTLTPTALTLSQTPQQILATITTGGQPASATPLCCILAAPILLFPLRRRTRRVLLHTLLLALLLSSATGCGRPAMLHLLLTPPGTYTYQVTARSTTAPTQTVNLTLTIQ